MAKAPTNMAASVKDRLLKMARAESRVFETVLVRFALERFLYRLSLSPVRDRFVLKGGLLVTTWIDHDFRTTRDEDFLGFGTPDADELLATIKTVMAIEFDDGLAFDLEALTATPIREEMEYGGVRLRTRAHLERTAIPITIDIGFGDAMADHGLEIAYPSVLDFPKAKLRAYSPATVMAEKFQAIVALGQLNGRMKDYFDLWAIPRSLVVSTADLDAAILATFTRRATAIPATAPIGLSQGMVQDLAKQRQWKAYAASIGEEKLDFATVIDGIWASLGPSCLRLRLK
jgi:Nucleotidyl transferase AbiEii toxin, Type IV TA system